MDSIQVLFLIVIWSLPIIIFTTYYLKLDKEGQKNLRNEIKIEIKKPSILFGLGVPVIGLMLLFSGSISEMKPFTQIGLIILIISCFAIGIEGWIKKERKFSSNASLMLWGLILTVAYIYLT